MIDYGLASHRCVFVFPLPEVKYAIKFLLFPGKTVPDDDDGGVQGCFVWGPRNRRLADATFLGELHLAEGALDVEVICHEAYHIAHHAWTSDEHDEEDCAELAGMVSAAVCMELRRLGKTVMAMLETDKVERFDDLWPGVEYRNQQFDFSKQDSPVETGEAL